MTLEYGRRIGKAFEAIYQLHKDAAQLLRECDTSVGQDRSSLFGNTVNNDLSKAINDPNRWMPYAVYRYYDWSDREPGLVEGLMIHFWWDPPKPQEPLLIAGQLKYLLQEQQIKDVCDEWDLWHAAFEWSSDNSSGQVVELTNVGDGRIERLRLLA